MPDKPADTPAHRRAESDREAGFTILDAFQRFHQRDDVFSRSFWDDEVRSGRSELFYETYRTPLDKWKTVDGFTQRDYAVRNASWHVPDVFAELKGEQDRREGFLDEFSVLRDGPETKVEVTSPADMAADVKAVARTFGADLVGIAEYDERWVYASKYSRRTDGEKPQEIPEGMTSVIVIAQAMDFDLIKTVPSALSGTATGIGYSRDTMVLLALAQYIVSDDFAPVVVEGPFEPAQVDVSPESVVDSGESDGFLVPEVPFEPAQVDSSSESAVDVEEAGSGELSVEPHSFFNTTEADDDAGGFGCRPRRQRRIGGTNPRAPQRR